MPTSPWAGTVSAGQRTIRSLITVPARPARSQYDPDIPGSGLVTVIKEQLLSYMSW